MTNPFKTVKDKQLDNRVKELLRQNPNGTQARAGGQRKAIGKAANGKDILMDFVSFVPQGFPGETMLVPYAAIRVSDGPAQILFQSQGEALFWTTMMRAEPLIRELHKAIDEDDTGHTANQNAAMDKATKFLALLDVLRKKVPAMAQPDTEDKPGLELVPTPPADTPKPTADELITKAMADTAYSAKVGGHPQIVHGSEPEPTMEDINARIAAAAASAPVDDE